MGEERRQWGRLIGELEWRCYERQRRDLELAEEGLLWSHGAMLWWDAEAADEKVEFIEATCVHVEGPLGRQPFVLAPFQRWIVETLFGWKKLPPTFLRMCAEVGADPRDVASAMTAEERLASGIVRRYRHGYMEVPRKNAKSMLSSAIAYAMLVADREEGAQVYTAATRRDQAAIIYDTLQRMVELGQQVETNCSWAEMVRRHGDEASARAAVLRRAVASTLTVTRGRKNISHVGSNSKFEPLTADASGLEGKNPSCVLIDELHAHKTGALFDVLATAMHARLNGLLFSVTTAGAGRHGICYDQRLMSERILDPEDATINDGMFVFIACADKGDDWRDERTWEKANPGIDLCFDREALRVMVTAARISPARRAAFERYYLNIWQSIEQRWMDMDYYRAASGQHPRQGWVAGPGGCREPSGWPGMLSGRDCWLGIDLAASLDLCGMAAVFPPVVEYDAERHGDGLVFAPDADPYWRMVYWAWSPEGALDRHGASERDQFPHWAREGFLVLTPGDVVDQNIMIGAVASAASEWNVREICYDPWNATKCISDLDAAGYGSRLVEVRQGYKTLSSAMKQFELLIYKRAVMLSSHPVAAWCMGNVCVDIDSNENIKPNKDRSIERIDLTVAAVCAMSRAIGVHDPVVVYSPPIIIDLGSAD